MQEGKSDTATEDGTRSKNDVKTLRQKEEWMREAADGFVIYWLLIVQRAASPRMEETQCSNGTIGCMKKRRRTSRREQKKSIGSLWVGWSQVLEEVQTSCT